MKKLVTFVGAVLCCASSFAITGKEVVDKYFSENPAPVFSRTEFKVESFKNGKIDDSLTLIQFGRNKNELTETVFEVTKNPGLKGTRFLQSQKKNTADARWIFTPALKSVRKIGSQDGAKSFVGTEFTYNDTALRDTDEDNHTLVSENQSVSVGNSTYNCYIVKSDPKSKRNIEFDYRIQYFDKNSMIPVKIEYFDKSGKMVKKMEVTKLEQLVGVSGKKYNLRKVAEITNMQTGRRSVLTILSMELDKELKSTYFSQNWLSTGKN